MASTDLDVRYVAQLARLNLSEEEIASFQKQLGKVLEFVDQLSAVDVSTVEPMAHASAVFDIVREDAIGPSFDVAVVMANAPRKANDLVMVPKVVE